MHRITQENVPPFIRRRGTTSGSMKCIRNGKAHAEFSRQRLAKKRLAPPRPPSDVDTAARRDVNSNACRPTKCQRQHLHDGFTLVNGWRNPRAADSCDASAAAAVTRSSGPLAAATTAAPSPAEPFGRPLRTFFPSPTSSSTTCPACASAPSSSTCRAAVVGGMTDAIRNSIRSSTSPGRRRIVRSVPVVSTSNNPNQPTIHFLNLKYRSTVIANRAKPRAPSPLARESDQDCCRIRRHAA